MLIKIKYIFYRLLLFFSKLFIGPGLKEIKGLENLPKDEGFIIAANHINSLDQFAIAAAIKKFLVGNFLKRGKKLYFIGELAIKKRIYSFFLNEETGYLPSTKSGIDRAVELLEEGNIIGIFPEGRRNSSESTSKGKRGIAFMALPSGVSIIPTACFGPATFSFFQGLKYFFLSKKIIFGKPIKFFKKEKSYLLNNPLTSRLATDIIMLEITNLCRKKYGF